MFQILSNVQCGDTVQLQQSIDNSKRNLHDRLRSTLYTVGWYNTNYDYIYRKLSGNTAPKDIQAIMPGLWSSTMITDMINARGRSAVSVNKANGIITLTGNGTDNIMMSKDIINLLGLLPNPAALWLTSNNFGAAVVNFSQFKTLHVELDQINTTSNVYNWSPSSTLASIGWKTTFFEK